MSDRPTVVHLIDDTTAGGVMRVLDHIRTSPDLAELADHRFQTVRRGKVSLRRYDADIIVSHLAISWRSMPALQAIRLANRGKTFVHVEHSYTEAFAHHNVPNLRRFHALLRFGFSMFDAIVAVSHGQADWIKRTGLCSEHKLFEIRSCVDLSVFKDLRPAQTPPKVVGAIGRLDRQKGFDTLIEGFRALPNKDVALHIYGTGDELENLRTLANGDARIQFKGFLPNPVHAYEDVDVVVIPSRWEAYGLVAIEALCAGRMTLCADVDGLNDHKDYGARSFKAQSAQDITRQLGIILADVDSVSSMCPHDICNSAQSAFCMGWKTLLEAIDRR